MKIKDNVAEVILREIETMIETCVDDPEDLPLDILDKIKGYFSTRELIDNADQR